MPTYKYKAKNLSGKTIEETIEAASEQELRSKLDSLQYFLIEFSQVTGVGRLAIASPLSARVNIKELSIFSWQLYTLLNSGVTLLDSLAALVKQTRNKKFQSVIEDVKNRVEKGSSFSQSLKIYPNVFPNLYVQMVNAGEAGGVLEEMIRRLAVFWEKQAEIRNKIKAAMIYPVVLVVASLGVASFLVWVILPRFVVMFNDMGVVLPWPTRMLLGFSDLLKKYFYLIPVFVVGGWFGLKKFQKTPQGRILLAKFALSVPVIGPLNQRTVLSRFSETLSILINSGIPILTALSITKDTVENAVISDALVEVSSQVSKGQAIAPLLAKSKYFPDMVVNMIKVGEETGSLNKMLTKVSEFYDRELNEAIDTFTKLIEPVFLILMAVVIGFIAISIFMPLSEILQMAH